MQLALPSLSSEAVGCILPVGNVVMSLTDFDLVNLALYQCSLYSYISLSYFLVEVEIVC